MNFLWIFYYTSGWNETEWYFLFSLFLGLFQPFMAWNEATMVFFNFRNFFSIFLEFSITRRRGTKRNDNFCFLSFSAFFNVIWLEMKSQWYFFNLFKLFSFFLEFSITRQVEAEQNDSFYFLPFSAFPPLFWFEMKP